MKTNQTQQMQTTGLARPPLPQSRDISDILRIMNTNMERSSDGKRWQIAESKLSRPGVRSALEGRSIELSRSLIRAPRNALASAIAGMFLRFPASANAPDQDARIAAYVADLASFPMWAIEIAIAGARNTFAPSSGELVDATRKAMQHVTDEQASISKVLQAEVIPPEDHDERERVKAGFQELLYSTQGQYDVDAFGKPSRLTKSDYIRMVEELEQNPVDLPQMSDELKVLVGVQSNGKY